MLFLVSFCLSLIFVNKFVENSAHYRTKIATKTSFTGLNFIQIVLALPKVILYSLSWNVPRAFFRTLAPVSVQWYT